ncbi:hypothetical protein [Cryptosporangium phraense]|uniref:Phosphodiesterase n=1 Tax=Cryptosporangium phraense TaxID=2593070 RepID=A0A545AMJ9_9ACTN|nr:hypothetical protein [Cryptosporangium phraense]TQS41955.1 hypothetical protein FL583_27125 [Cryptosporangium phraense]
MPTDTPPSPVSAPGALAERPGEQPGDRPSDRPSDRPGDRPGARPAARPGERPSAAVAGLARVVGAAFGLVARVRGAKALHPTGSLHRGRVHRSGLTDPTGVGWLDTPGTDEVVVRLSRAGGFPSALPDVLGLALRTEVDGNPADLLLSTAGRAPVSRHVLRFRRDPHRAVYTSVTPYRAPAGLVMVAALPAPPAFDLVVAAPRGAWRRFGRLELTADLADDLSFDPVRNPIPGLVLPEPLASMRAASYRRSRSGRSGAFPGRSIK